MCHIFTKCTECCKIIENLGIRKTKEEKNTNAVSLNVPYAKKA